MTRHVRSAAGVVAIMALFAAGAASLVAQAPQGGRRPAAAGADRSRRRC